MPNIQVFPSANAATTITVKGRVYTCAVGSVITVPDFDALVLLSNGWLKSASDGAGTTAQRPAAVDGSGAITYPGGPGTAPRVGYEYFDTTVGAKLGPSRHRRECVIWFRAGALASVKKAGRLRGSLQ